jgi:predicted nuclease with TOPRIM domain
MSAELIGIISVGVALGAMILTSVGLTFAAWRWLADSVDKRFNVSEARIDNRFDEVDKRFDKMDKRFDKMDKRFDEADKRFEGIEGRLSALEQRVARLEGVLDGLREALFERAAR